MTKPSDRRRPAARRRAAPAAAVATEARPAAVDLGSLPNLIGYMLRRAQVTVFQDFFRTFAEVGIRPAQYAVLTVIELNPGLKQSEVGAALGIKRTNFVGLLDGLEARGLAERRPVETDRRSYALYLTQAGVALMRELRRLQERHEARFVARIGETGREQLLALLTSIAALGDGALFGDVEDEVETPRRAATVRPKTSRSLRRGSAEP